MKRCLIAIFGVLVACAPLWTGHSEKTGGTPRSSLLVFTIAVDTTHSSPGDTRILFRLENISPLVLAVTEPGCSRRDTYPEADDSLGQHISPAFLLKTIPCDAPPKRLEPGASIEALSGYALEWNFGRQSLTGVRVRFEYQGVVKDEQGRSLCNDYDVLVSNTLMLM